MGCNNSHLRPFFRRCRRRRSKKEESVGSPVKGEIQIERNGNTDLAQSVHLLGASLSKNHTSSSPNNSPFRHFDSSSTKNNSSTDPTLPFSVPLLAQTEASSSQQDFFKLLDQKIEEGPDYESSEEEELCRRAYDKKFNSSLRLKMSGNIGTSPKPNLTKFPNRNSPLKFTNWNWDEEGD